MKTTRPRETPRVTLSFLLTCASLLSAPVPAQVVNPPYEPSGVGGQPRTPQQWMSERPVSLKDYKCVGDGIADDTACIQNAVIELFRRQGGALYVP
jgi:polygalacturonase